ncbi:hypothetical protein HFO42_22585 [Rhizobium leguminosarum]|uniref:Uncharacterized protein n=1 Tax=Rhizobium leguminosarum TaxID=384 RepID=A0AAJ1ABQ4_RHILE|nr:hypothetical protein [Rhizobium leguminosarum]MBY5533756.1 hypothetical protein [Rhizobium leguminosarum]MBY5594844.1 hypothetical protein [Rhizobium leguminosarum]MBY5609329.1 hypothetical protein [Rhizobium leguminosarum]MBY5630869.1 hypothetical protein [Rhizobium leguminosarum]MBY5645492.1 hypothetical protein [Rhizobium leguminosarum]
MAEDEQKLLEMDTATQIALALGATTLGSWILAGVAAVYGASIRMGVNAEWVAARVSVGFEVLGLLSALGMATALAAF